jgi:anti-anti-sigma factor
MRVEIKGTTVFIKGRLDSLTAESAREQLSGVVYSVNVDLSQLDYISSAGLGVLLELKKRLVALDHDVAVGPMPPHVRKIFELSGLDQVFALK